VAEDLRSTGGLEEPHRRHSSGARGRRQEAHVHRDDVPARVPVHRPVTEGASASGAAASRPAKVWSDVMTRSAQLHQCLERMSSKAERQIVFVTGEPGIGKTAVADAFIDRAADASPDIRLARGQLHRGLWEQEAIYPMLEYWRGCAAGTAETRSSRSWRPRLPPGSSSFRAAHPGPWRNFEARSPGRHPRADAAGDRRRAGGDRVAKAARDRCSRISSGSTIRPSI